MNSINHKWCNIYAVLIFLSGLFFLSGCEDEDDFPMGELKACFEYDVDEINDGKVQFYNCSENATNYLWDFGDGQTSTKKQPNHVFSGERPYYVTLIAYKGTETDTLSSLVYDDIMVYKPNIYIYPEEEMDMCLNISFPMGGEITESIPKYENQWCVTVDANGRIDDQYDFLFYESKQPNIFQYSKGWCVEQSGLTTFFETNLAAFNFSLAEIADFLEYWIPLLSENEYYLIYPQTNKIIDRIIELDFSTSPDNINRLFYGFEGIDEFAVLEEPVIIPFERDGFTVMEWGGFWK
ncbi:PKD domain-containing protein [Maribellus sediminis]|uniref:PKD domain-containing protein n=1 Tax=Maribellus sediminis TaxID=2696285 RepID=UPI001431F3F8|nr:PKD domain-containing protein [Maribellus sediminis]